MFGSVFKFFSEIGNVERAVEKGAYRSFGHAAASVRKEAIHSVQQDEDPSPAGSPPHTKKGRLWRAIVYHATKTGAVIGPRFSRFGTAGGAHEHGGRYKGATFPKRSFMQPALEKNLGRFVGSFRGSIGRNF